MFNVFVYRNGWCMLEGHLGRRSPFREGGVSRLRQAFYSNVANPPSQLRIHVRTNPTLRPLASNTIQVHHSHTPPHPRFSSVCLSLTSEYHTDATFIDWHLYSCDNRSLSWPQITSNTCRKNVPMRSIWCPAWQCLLDKIYKPGCIIWLQFCVNPAPWALKLKCLTCPRELISRLQVS